MSYDEKGRLTIGVEAYIVGLGFFYLMGLGLIGKGIHVVITTSGYGIGYFAVAALSLFLGIRGTWDYFHVERVVCDEEDPQSEEGGVH